MNDSTVSSTMSKKEWWKNRLENDFTYHKPFGNQPERYEQLRNNGKWLAELIVSLCPDSRERSLAITSLEEAVFWANAAIARNENEVQEEKTDQKDSA